MSGHAVPPLLQYIRRLAATASSDEQLLADFIARRSDEAFSALLARHGPMVLNLCRRILDDGHAAEDVFQATFLVLVDRAGAIHRRESLASFLHGVACRLAVRARRRRRQNLPTSVCDEAVGVPEGLAWQEILGILDQELARLSDDSRAPLVLCYLEGRTQDEAARQLGWSLSTLRRRLAQGRGLLEVRLRGRGVTLPAALTGVLATSTVAVPGSLRAATLAAASARTIAGMTAGLSVLSSVKKGIVLLLSTSAKKVGVSVAVAVLGAALCFGYCWTPSANRAPPASTPPATVSAPAAGAVSHDPPAEPLPAQATVRLGTDRYRYGSQIESMAVSADGRFAVVSCGVGRDYGLFRPPQFFDLTDGRCLYSVIKPRPLAV